MSYLEFYEQLHELGCFNINQVYSWYPSFNRMNIRNWVDKGLIVKLRKEWYAFADYLSKPDFAEYIANRIYRPSYISLQYAMAHYGMIPESVMQITSVTSLKTMRFSNVFGEFSYQTVKRDMMTGYRPAVMDDGRSILIATPEKALLDFLYLYPFYKTERDLSDLRLDEDFMMDEFDYEVFHDYACISERKTLKKIAETLKSIYKP